MKSELLNDAVERLVTAVADVLCEGLLENRCDFPLEEATERRQESVPEEAIEHISIEF